MCTQTAVLIELCLMLIKSDKNCWKCQQTRQEFGTLAPFPDSSTYPLINKFVTQDFAVDKVPFSNATVACSLGLIIAEEGER